MTQYSDQPKTFPDYPLDKYDSIFKPDILSNRYALITGGGSGINFRVTEGFMAHGCNVAIASRNIDRVRTASQRLLKKYPNVKCLYFTMDISKDKSVINCIDGILKVFPRIDILVNGAAGNFLCKIENMSFNAYKRIFEIDAFGTFMVTKTVFDKSMRYNYSKYGINSYIINMTTSLDKKGDLYQAHCHGAKAAINSFTRHCSVEWGKYHININSVAPGPTSNTAGVFKLGGFMTKNIEKMYSKDIPLKRFGTKQEIADICIFLCSNKANYVTGTTIVSDGGHWLTGMTVTNENIPTVDKMIGMFATKKGKKSKL